MCSLDGRRGTNTGAIPGNVKQASLEGLKRWKVLAWDKSASRRALIDSLCGSAVRLQFWERDGAQ